MVDKKKVLIVTEGLNYGGMNTVALRLQQSLNDDYEFVYCLRHGIEENDMERCVAENNIRVITDLKEHTSYLKSFLFFIKLFKNEKFDIVHSHYPFYSAIIMISALLCGVPKRITHSHFSYEVYNDFSKIKHILVYFYRFLMRVLITVFSTEIIACSLEAGQYVCGKVGFSKKGIILNNPIDVNKFAYDEKKRKAFRDKLCIPDDMVIFGNIGKMYYIKNQRFIIDWFNQYIKRYPNSRLYLVGDGEDRDFLEKKVSSYKLGGDVVFTGKVDNVNDYLMAFDCLIFPSLHEGYPLVLIEAQAANLPCLVSSTITHSVKYNDNLYFASLEDGFDKWSLSIIELLKQKRECVDNKDLLKSFNIKTISEQLKEIYEI